MVPALWNPSLRHLVRWSACIMCILAHMVEYNHSYLSRLWARGPQGYYRCSKRRQKHPRRRLKTGNLQYKVCFLKNLNAIHLYIYAYHSWSLVEKKAKFHVVGVFQAHMCIALQAIKSVMMSRTHPRPMCLILLYLSQEYSLCLFDWRFFGSEGEKKTGCAGNLSFMFCTSPTTELRRHHGPTLWRLASPSAHNASSWRILWGGGATEPWNDAGIHYHQRSAVSSVDKMC